ncbi:MAG: sulfite exporter TauE/SafE family protein [Dermatophilaceae bacterium]
MSALDAVLVLLAGLAAGAINTVVGSGTLVTFPTLLVLGYPPLTANVSNNIGLVAGGLSGSWGYRHELTGQSGALRRLAPASFVGSVVGATLLLVLPAAAFKAIVPVLVAVALVFVVVGPRLQAAAARRQAATAPTAAWRGWALIGGVLLSGVYGGYFGAAQGILMMGVFSALSSMPLQRATGFKNVLVTLVNLVATVAFLLFAREHVDWFVVVLIALGSFAGGVLGARVGRRLPPQVLRGAILVVGTVALVKLVWFS